MSQAPVPMDAAVRERALHPATSFIVQAPAGSGKTELLTRRVLTLLATVDEPEAILAITFTRKAASEMRSRVMEALQQADIGVEPDNAHDREGYRLARTVLVRDSEREWHLLENPQRLMLKTIDGLSAMLAHRLPVTSQLGAPAAPVDDARELYLVAARRLLRQQMQALPAVFLQFGNRFDQIESMMADMLAKRDQWQRLLSGDFDDDQLRQHLESMLRQLIESRLATALALAPVGFSEVVGWIQEAALRHEVLENAGPPCKPVAEMKQRGDLQSMAGVPSAAADDLLVWQGVIGVLLTAGDTVRKSCNRALGFPSTKDDAAALSLPMAELKARSQQMKAFLESLADQQAFVDSLMEVRELPEAHYTDADWACLVQLLRALGPLRLELHAEFTDRGQVDFIEMADRARRALGTDEAPTDLALAMDLRIKHVLVDEFQDTSLTQFELFEQLVAGWEVDDGRTFFAVGDPMQSIYRFRNADVSLFSRARDHGIGTVPLEPLHLEVNFRSSPAVIGWVNETFADVFPDEADPLIGAVPYSPSQAFFQDVGSVQTHALVADNDASPAELSGRHDAAVANCVAAAIAIDPEHRVAILVRSRSHAAGIFAALRARHINYVAVDMDLLGERPVVRDLLSLCLALRYPQDRAHWLALLRAPWCGLSLDDLHALVSTEKRTVMQLAHDADRVASLSADGQARLQRFLLVMDPAVQRAPRTALVPWIESCWIKLGGPALCQNALDQNAAERCLASLRELEAEGRLWQASVIEATMNRLYAESPDADAVQVQVMTVHKSKGLEFDTVILPALQKPPRGSTSGLVSWLEYQDANGESLFLLTPRDESGKSADKNFRSISKLVSAAEKRVDRQENLRLLYVACTRARQYLHVFGTAKLSRKGELTKPPLASLLRPLWNRWLAEFDAARDAHMPVETMDSVAASHVDSDGGLKRIPLDWRCPDFPSFTWQQPLENSTPDVQDVEFAWASTTARAVGTVVHRLLQQAGSAANNGGEALTAGDTLSRRARLHLRHLGVVPGDLDAATVRVENAVTNTLADERGRWILDASHTEVRSEWALSAAEPSVRRVVIDRTFVDANGVRWIVDFKTGDHQGGKLDAFLDREQTRYTDQLRAYADIIRHMDNRPIRLGLYFPLLRGWREVSLEAS